MFKKVLFLTLISLLYEPSQLYAAKDVVNRYAPLTVSATPIHRLTGYGLYLEPGEVNRIYPELNGRYDWGFFLGYDYDTTENRIWYLQWYHMNTTKKNLVHLVSDLHDEGPTNITYGYVKRFDILYFQLAQPIRFFDSMFKLHGGLEYAHLQSRTDHFLSSNITSSEERGNTHGKYGAYGPVVGIDFYYPFTPKLTYFFVSDFSIIIHQVNFDESNRQIDSTGAARFEKNTSDFITLNGSTSSVVFSTGLSFSKQTSGRQIEFQFGWNAIIFDLPSVMWSGAFLGSKWSW